MPQKSNKEYFGKDLEAMSFAKNYHAWIMDEIAPYLGKRVAEVGAGTGNFSSFLLSHPLHSLVAFEPSQNMYADLSAKFSSNKSVKTINAFFEDHPHAYAEFFDSVCYINVLEHIKKDGVALSHAYTTLRTGGHIIIFVPALNALYSNLDKRLGHYRRYNKRELTKKVSAAGFEIQKLKYFDIVGIIPWYIAFVLLGQTVTPKNVSAYDKLVVPLMRKFEQFVTPPLGKNLVLVGQKL